MTLLIGTFNMGNAPPPKDLSPWLSFGVGKRADVYVIGVQECAFENSNGNADIVGGTNHEATARSPTGDPVGVNGRAPKGLFRRSSQAHPMNGHGRAMRHEDSLFVSGVMDWLGNDYKLVTHRSMVITGSIRLLVACRNEVRRVSSAVPSPTSLRTHHPLTRPASD